MNVLRTLYLTALIILTVSSTSPAAQLPPDTITMHIPEQVIGRALGKILPLTFADQSEKLEGTVTIVRVADLQIHNKTVIGHLEVQGRDLNLLSTVADQKIRLKLGDARIDFDCEVGLRYDAASKTLYLTPLAKDIPADQSLQEGDIGNALLLLMSGREFPVELQDLEPIIAEASNKTIVITTAIADINAVAGALQVQLLPEVEARPR